MDAELDGAGWTPIYWACRYGSYECLRHLLKWGADPRKGNKRGWSPLFAAALHGHLDCVKFLLEDVGRRNRKMERGVAENAGADPNKATTEAYSGVPAGARPLDAAHHSKQLDVTHEARWKVAAALKRAGAEHGAWYTPPTKKEKAGGEDVGAAEANFAKLAGKKKGTRGGGAPGDDG